MKILLLDNYDSFTYNLAQLVAATGCAFEVIRNDRLSVEAVAAYDKVLFSPGPGLPAEAGRMPQLIARWATEKSMLGICLGHQAIAESFGARLYNLGEVAHGITTTVTRTDPPDTLFRGLSPTFAAGLYHSWAVDSATLPDCLQVTATNEKGVIMALKHKTCDVHGLQFHPESVLTPDGATLIRNWIFHDKP